MENTFFTFFLILFLGFCFLSASWARFYRMNYKFHAPLPFLLYPKRYYTARWILLIILICASFFLEFPFWIVIVLFLISIWLGRQYTTVKLSLEFRRKYRQGELNDDEGNLITPIQALDNAIRAEKNWSEEYKKGNVLW